MNFTSLDAKLDPLFGRQVLGSKTLCARGLAWGVWPLGSFLGVWPWEIWPRGLTRGAECVVLAIALNFSKFQFL